MEDTAASSVMGGVGGMIEPQMSGSSYEPNGPAGGAVASTPCYDDLFPALPESEPPRFNNTLSPATQNMRVGSSIVTQVFIVPSGERKYDSDKFGEGESLRTCQTIMKETHAHIEISSGKDQSLTFLVTGKLNEVLEARRKILVHFQTQASKTISIPREHHRWILGKKGDRLRELERSTSTKINVPRISEDSDAITILGTKEGIEKAEHEIRTMSDEQSRKAFERFNVPKIYHPFVIGAFGENLQKMTAETGAKINVPPQSVQKDEIIITGEKEGVLQAKARIEAIYKEMEKKCTSVAVEVSRAQHKYVYGPRGTTIQEILQMTGVSVEMPPSDSPSDTITLRGPQDKLGNALSVVYQKAHSIRTNVLECPQWIHKYIIGREGSLIKEFSVQHPNVHVEFNEDKIKIDGPPEQVEIASEQLQAKVNELSARLTFAEMMVDPVHCKHIIGKAGSNINRMKEEYEVQINIDEKDAKPIRIEGPAEGVAKAQQELLEKIAKWENEKEESIIIDHRLFKTIIGAKGESIREIREKHNQVQIVFPGPNDKSDIVKIRGPKEDVDRCHKYLAQYVKELQKSSFMMEVPIFKQFHKYIIGKGGANIKKIRDETQTKIDLPAEGDSNEVIVITGKKENVKEARERIQKIQNEMANIVTEEIVIPAKHHISLIGAGGMLINSIMEECGGVSIKFPSSDSKSDKVIVRGPKEDVERAKQQLLELSSEKELSSYSVQIRAKPQHHKFLIGKNGASIKKIRDKTGARVIFPGVNDEDNEAITIIGKKENVEEAKVELEAIIKNIDNIVEDELTIDPKYHKHFVSNRGKVLRRIEEECGGMAISFPRSDRGERLDRVTLKGPKDCIEAAKQRMLEIVTELESMVTIECYIPARHHRIVMGKGGSKVQAITSEFGVNIKFPERVVVDYQIPHFGDVAAQNGNGAPGESSGESAIGSEIVNGGASEQTVAPSEPVHSPADLIRISGNQERCEQAKEALLALVPETEEINVPFDLHRSLIGQKGRDVKELMNAYDVHIEMSPQDKKLDIIKVTGTKTAIAEAKVAIAERIKQLEADREDREARSFEVKLEVDPVYHQKIIGRRGAVINKIRANHGVQISFPKQDDPYNKNVITIQGYEEKANAARDEILAMVDTLSSVYKEEVSIDERTHRRFIGFRGKRLREIKEQFNVEITFPRPEDADKSLVTLAGTPDNVEACRDYLLNLEEEFLQDVSAAPTAPTTFSQIMEDVSHANANKQGFIVSGAPWERKTPNTQSLEDFPDFGGLGGGPAGGAPSGPVADSQGPINSAWNAKH
ncbi:vigilin [Anopheles darlingi]|uniref:vigilin n=1 Tax=Anopheles darlingi TaxID=43151 RepID=UPI0021006189|nr:vigilin [Anopheles darlingi]XP_049542274.1 vigilin [Anopheles darlingi]XP_049542275.1 vigilin [Anopheles darlingi]XP_049542276.1 vigilin [Anopheles darlingi]XP_049542277.1 vigilin [Anopheles darlingi]XP_049542279.1 vigilin [Anopheles darlingi]XP_049542280.1 vigilin [Anopheles darlingi]XP_049542281.1 vigilin [Anopheles darlingi]XP_049542282.1 vigilin [Anopheles darlingi]